MRAPSSQEVNELHLLLDVFDEKIVIPPCTFPDTRTLNRPSWGSSRNRRHAQHDMTAIISSTGSCQVRCVSLDVATILCIVTQHDREGPEAWPYARHERDILTREGKKDQNGLVLAHGGDTLSDPGAYFSL